MAGIFFPSHRHAMADRQIAWRTVDGVSYGEFRLGSRPVSIERGNCAAARAISIPPSIGLLLMAPRKASRRWLTFRGLNSTGAIFLLDPDVDRHAAGSGGRY